MGEQLLQVQSDVRSLVGVDAHAIALLVEVLVSICDVHPLVAQVVDHCLEVSTVESGEDVADCVFSCDVSVVFGQHFVKSLVERRAYPVHPVIDGIFNGLVPICDWQRVSVIDNIADTVRDLETAEVVFVAIANPKDQVAGPTSRLHAVDRLLDILIPLKHVPQHESERVSNSRFLAKCLIGVGDSNFRNSHLVFVDS